jgi:rhomboid family GlyGly-CTERM serine protease
MISKFLKKFPDLVAFGLALLLLNLHLFGLPVDHRAFVVAPSVLAAGRWWTLVTHAFVHVSPYHLLLDAGAVLCIYPSLSHRPGKRLVALGVCLLGSGLGAMLSPMADVHGFCGLSGAGHGLLAVLAVQLARSPARTERRIGVLLATGLLLKSLIEAASGQVLFGGLHLGSVGTPNTVSHLAGTVTGLLFAGALAFRRSAPVRNIYCIR